MSDTVMLAIIGGFVTTVLALISGIIVPIVTFILKSREDRIAAEKVAANVACVADLKQILHKPSLTIPARLPRLPKTASRGSIRNNLRNLLTRAYV